MFNLWPKSKSAASPTPPPQRRVVIVETELGSLTLDQWRGDKGLTEQAHGALTSPLLRRMLQVLHNSHPAFQVMMSGDTNARALQQARCEGYTMALADLESMGGHLPTPEAMEAGFEGEEVDPKLVEAFSSKGKSRA